MPTIQPIQQSGRVIGWNVTIEREQPQAMFCVNDIVPVLLEELPIPDYPTAHQIEHVARVKLSPPKPPCKLRRRSADRTTWSKAHEVCRDVALRDGLRIDQLVDALPGALETLQHEYEQIEQARQTARAMTKLSRKAVQRVDDQYQDYTSIQGFDCIAQELPMIHPELNWPADDPTGNSARLWDLLHTADMKRPTRLSQETIERAAELVADRLRGEIEFAEWSDNDSLSDDADSVPF